MWAVWLILWPVFFSLPALSADYAVEITSTPPKVANPGDIVTHVFQVFNRGTQDDVYQLALTLPEGWTSLPVPASLAVEAGEVGVVFVNVAVPRAAPAGDYQLVLQVASSGDPAVRAQATAVVRVQPHWDFRVDWEKRPPRAQAGKELSGAVRVTNTGNAPDQYTVEVTVSTGWDARAYPNSFDLFPGETRTVEFAIQVPATASSGTNYAIVVTVTSTRAPALSRTLSTTGRVAPPPPELVGGSLFPEWTVSLTLSMDKSGSPEFGFRGWGDIEGFDFYIDTNFTITLTGMEDARLALVWDDWSVFIDGGTISGAYLGVSGSPLFGIHRVEGLGGQVLFTQDVKGFSATWREDRNLLRVVAASDTVHGLSFEEAWLRYDFEGPASGWALISHGTQTESGYIFGLGGVVEEVDYQLEASGTWVGEGYPNQTPRLESDVLFTYEKCSFPVELSYRYSRVQAGPQTQPFHVHSHTLRSSASFPTVTYINPRFSIDFGWRGSDDTPQSTRERSYGASLSFRGDTPWSWSLQGSLRNTDDLIAGTSTFSHSIGGQLQVPFDSILLTVGVSLSSMSGPGGTTVGSDATLRADFPDLPGAPRITLTAGGGASTISFQATGALFGETELDWSWNYTTNPAGISTWATSFTLRFPTPFPFCGPVRGRISGRLFLDVDRDGRWSPGDEGIEGILVTADGAEAITGTGGRFVFPPLEPGTYKLALEGLPPGLAPAKPLPKVNLTAGAELELTIPLRPQSWIRGRVFNDTNKNGLLDSGEAGIPNVRIVVQGEGGQWELFTDSGGLFVLAVEPGTYRVTLDTDTLPERFELTTPASVEVEVPERKVVRVEFGAYRKPRPVVITFGPPTARFSYSPTSPVVGQPVHFSGADSTAVNAKIVEYQWEFKLGDRVITASGCEVTVTFPEPGTWQVTLLVKDSNGLPAATRGTVEVRPAG